MDCDFRFPPIKRCLNGRCWYLHLALKPEQWLGYSFPDNFLHPSLLKQSVLPRLEAGCRDFERHLLRQTCESPDSILRYPPPQNRTTSPTSFHLYAMSRKWNYRQV